MRCPWTPATQRRQLVELARTVAEERAGVVPKRVLLQQGVVELQRRIRQQKRRARHIAAFHPSIVPGLLQTERYIRVIAAGPPETSSAENEAWVRERLARQLQMAQPGRSTVQILTESALHWGIAGAEVMVEQCGHLIRLATTRPDWRVGVVPRVLPPRSAPLFVTNGFDIHDAAAVHIGTSAGNALITDQRLVQDHVELFARIEALAVFGEEAAELLTRVADLYRGDFR